MSKKFQQECHSQAATPTRLFRTLPSIDRYLQESATTTTSQDVLIEAAGEISPTHPQQHFDVHRQDPPCFQSHSWLTCLGKKDHPPQKATRGPSGAELCSAEPTAAPWAGSGTQPQVPLLSFQSENSACHTDYGFIFCYEIVIWRRKKKIKENKKKEKKRKPAMPAFDHASPNNTSLLSFHILSQKVLLHIT